MHGVFPISFVCGWYGITIRNALLKNLGEAGHFEIGRALSGDLIFPGHLQACDRKFFLTCCDGPYKQKKMARRLTHKLSLTSHETEETRSFSPKSKCRQLIYIGYHFPC